MCQFARLYHLEVLGQFRFADKELETPTLEKVMTATNSLNEFTFVQEPPAQIKTSHSDENTFTQEIPAQIQDVTDTITQITQQAVAQIETNFAYSPISKVNWASHIKTDQRSFFLSSQS